MALDPSIILGYRAPQIESPVAQYGNVLAIQNAQNQNRLADTQFRRMEREEADNNALRQSLTGVDISTPDGLRTAQNALRNIGRLKEASDLGASALNQQNVKSQIDERTANRYRQNLGIFGAALAPLAQNPSREAIVSTLAGLKAQGIEAPPIPLPNDDALLPQWVRQAGAMTEQGLKALEAFAPKVSMSDTGGSLQPVNTNPLAGVIGPLAGAAAISKTATPDAIMTDLRTRQEGDKNRGVQIRGQNLTDARAREQLAATQAKDKALTETQGNATAFGMRARESADIINDLENNKTFGITANVMQGPADAANRLPIVGGALSAPLAAGANLFTSGDQQKYQQAKRNFISANLRKESGAAISPQEYESEDKKYFPQFGDSAAVIEQKRKARETAIEALRIQAGPGGGKIPNAKSPAQMTDAEIKKALGL